MSVNRNIKTIAAWLIYNPNTNQPLLLRLFPSSVACQAFKKKKNIDPKNYPTIKIEIKAPTNESF